MGLGLSSSAQYADPASSEYSLDAALEAAAEAIASAGSMTAFTGAGASVESGIPDFRSPGGLWSKYNPMVYCEYQNFCQRPYMFWQMGRELALEVHKANGGSEEDLRQGLREAAPNAGHVALAELEEMGILRTVITQNIDSLHQRAGSSKVIEIHGTMATASCMVSGRQVTQSEILRQWVAFRAQNPDANVATDKWVPRHPETNGVLKPDVTMFGEALPTGALGSSWAAVLGSPVCLVVGTGLDVAPANMVPGLVKWRFGTLIVLNLDRSGASGAHIFLQGRAGEVLPRLVAAVRQRQAPQT
eukprot:TRINITY_DN12060_c0_g1_i2.p1 TRINITY_DN12060_c0_g1~~TRINITY_DN12060_c0_g1_i2.p1  ORF type:complete len:302 (+),score=55.36 TRINITY_DN12060_c0_g1_i2:173-1078(+)